MKNDSQWLFVEPPGQTFERKDVGEDVLLLCRGLVVATFRRGESLGRDLAIASLLRVGCGLKTDTIAALCGASHGWVCEVRRRFKVGGLQAIVARGVRGQPRKLVGAKEDQLRNLHADGSSGRELAKVIGLSKSLVAREITRLGLPPRGWRNAQFSLPDAPGATGTPQTPCAAKVEAPPPEGPATCEAPAVPSEGGDASAGDEVEVALAALEGIADEEAIVAEKVDASEDAQVPSKELLAGAALESGPTEHPSRYAGTLLLCAAAMVLGVFSAFKEARAARPESAVYDGHQVLSALMAAWGAGYGSIEAMHERDARALGVIMGIERSPSVRTLHRAIAQMSARSDPIELNAALMRGVLSVRLPERLWFGLDGHFKAYAGTEPIDKGWDSKGRRATKGIADVVVTDARGFTWSVQPVAAGSALSQHLGDVARTLRGVVGKERPIVVTFDRGGFSFDVLDALDRDGIHYVGYVPSSVTLPDLSTIAPADDGVGEVAWSHERLHHRARLIVERDGTWVIPVVTNLPTLVDTVMVVEQLRVHRGAQENSFKAARAFAHIDRLVDRGAASHAPDDRLVSNPARAALKKRREEAMLLIERCKEMSTADGLSRKEINHDRFFAEVNLQQVESDLRSVPAKVERVKIEPDAQRAKLKTRNRLLLQPLKFAADNSRRWLLATLGPALAPSDRPFDQETSARTLLALLQAPGTVRLDDEQVTVTIELPLPPTPHARLAEALLALDARELLFGDGRRRVQFRLAPRPTRADIQRAS